MRVKRALAVAVCCLMISSSFMYAQAASGDMPPPWLLGCWVVTRDLPTSGQSGLSQVEIDSLLGRRIVYTSEYARSGAKVVSAPRFSVKSLSAGDFFDRYYFSPREIGIGENRVTEVVLIAPLMSDEEFPGNDIYRRGPDIVVNVEGASLLAVRAKLGDKRCERPVRK